MEARIVFVAIVAVVIVLSLLLTFIFSRPGETTPLQEEIEEKAKSFDPSKVKDCEDLMLGHNLQYVLCTEKNGKIALKDSIQFKAGEYLGLHVNMQKLDFPSDSYYSCVFSDFPLYETSYPYVESQPGIYFPSFVCSSLLYKKDYHHWALSGFVLNQKGEFTILRVYVFNGSLPSDFDFKNNLEEGEIVFELKGEVI
ncbi:MAG: hypothetical protein QXU74_01270 [Candidatus Aenigmatarchaeota archaeon]